VIIMQNGVTSCDKHIYFICPRPPSINRLWRTTHKGGKLRVYRSPQYTKWLEQFGKAWLLQKPRGFVSVDKPFSMSVTIYVGLKSRIDLDNVDGKGLLDACQRFGIITNDRLCRERHSRFETATDKEECLVEIQVLDR